MKKVLTAIIMAAILAAGLSLLAQAQTPAQTTASGPVKIGFINLHRAVTESNKGKSVINTLQAEVDKSKAKLDGKKKEIESLQTAFMANKDNWDVATRSAKQGEIEQKAKALQREAEDLEEYYNKRENEQLKPIFESLSRVIQDIGKNEGYTVIFDVTGAIVYKNAAVDLTDKIIKNFNLKK